MFNVIDELNRALEIHGVAIRGLGWEEYVSPGVAVHAQELINQQLLKEYDILIAIFGAKLGSPTATAISGTVEEIEHAIANVSSAMGQYRVQVYFREKIDTISDISADELKKVLEYREELRRKGVLYRLFKEGKELENEIRVNLHRPIIEFLQARHKKGISTSTPSNETKPSTLSSPADVQSILPSEELGFLDIAERGEDAMEAVISSIQRISDLIKELGDSASAQAEKIEQISNPNIPAREKKAVINGFAAFLKSRAADLKQQAVIAQENFLSYVSALMIAARMERESGDIERYQRGVAEFLKVAETLLSTLAMNRESMANLKAIVENLPRITIQFNQAKRDLLDALTECLQVYDRAERGIFEITAGT